MTMRDRLAADLPLPDGSPEPIGHVRRKWWRLGWLSANAVTLDRLIALGWTRLDEDELMQAKHDYAAKMLAIAREQGGVLVTEERLARALRLVAYGEAADEMADPMEVGDLSDNGYSTAADLAAALLAALREEP